MREIVRAQCLTPMISRAGIQTQALQFQRLPLATVPDCVSSAERRQRTLKAQQAVPCYASARICVHACVCMCA